MGWYEDQLAAGADPAKLDQAKALLDESFGAGLYNDPGNLESYLSGRAPWEEYAMDTAVRAFPTASSGGIGGDADLDYNGVIDPGWMRNPEGGGREWIWGGDPSMTPSASNNGQAMSTALLPPSLSSFLPANRWSGDPVWANAPTGPLADAVNGFRPPTASAANMPQAELSNAAQSHWAQVGTPRSPYPRDQETVRNLAEALNQYQSRYEQYKNALARPSTDLYHAG